MITLVKRFIEAESTRNWELHLNTLQQILLYFHATGHFLYATCAQLYFYRICLILKMLWMFLNTIHLRMKVFSLPSVAINFGRDLEWHGKHLQRYLFNIWAACWYTNFPNIKRHQRYWKVKIIFRCIRPISRF